MNVHDRQPEFVPVLEGMSLVLIGAFPTAIEYSSYPSHE